MARISVEECWWSDPRRSKLIKLLGDEDKADARVLKMWRLAQEFWKDDHELIPKEIFETLEDWQLLIDCRLAEIRASSEDSEVTSVYVRGSSQYLEWTIEEREKRVRGGKNSAKARREKYGSAIPHNASNAKKPELESEVTSEFGRSAPKKTEVSGSGSGSGSEEIQNTLMQSGAPNGAREGVSLALAKNEIPTRSEKEKPIPESERDPEILFSLWNQLCGPLPKARDFTPERRKKAKARLRDNGDPEYWASIIRKMAKSDFCRGESKSKWKANFDFFLRPGTHVRVLEGLYGCGSVSCGDYGPGRIVPA